jgi:arylsulfatase
VQEILGEHIQSLMDFPPAQKAATFDFSELMKSLMSGKQ